MGKKGRRGKGGEARRDGIALSLPHGTHAKRVHACRESNTRSSANTILPCSSKQAMAPHPPSSPSSAASTSGVALTAASPSTLLAPAPALRRLLLSLSKGALIALVQHWLCSSSSSIARPSLSARTVSSASKTRVFLHLHEQRRASSVPELLELWGTAMRDAGVPKARAVDRLLETDWQAGVSYEMVAMVACEAVRAGGSKTWTIAKLEFDGGQGESLVKPRSGGGGGEQH